jgi:hypothetical protein
MRLPFRGFDAPPREFRACGPRVRKPSESTRESSHLLPGTIVGGVVAWVPGRGAAPVLRIPSLTSRI